MEESEIIEEILKDGRKDPRLPTLYLRAVKLFITDDYKNFSDNQIQDRLHGWVKESLKIKP